MTNWDGKLIQVKINQLWNDTSNCYLTNNPLPVTFEMEHINRIKSDKGNKQTNICLCEFAASYISLSRQNFINLKSTQQTMIVEKQKLGMRTVLPTSHKLRCEKRSTFYYACIDNSFELMLYDVDKHQVLINLFAKT